MLRTDGIGRNSGDWVATGGLQDGNADALPRDGGTEDGRRTVDDNAIAEGEGCGGIEGRVLTEDVDNDILCTLHGRARIDDGQRGLGHVYGERNVVHLRASGE